MRLFICLFFVLFITGCSETGSEQYEKIKLKELASGKLVNNIFFDINFGMTSKEFYSYCWEMNKKGMFTDGNNNHYVLYKLDSNQLKYPASMNFYPGFINNKIGTMQVLFQYDGWAPWNKKLFSDSLQADVLALYKKWYPNSNPFIKIEDKVKGTIYVKVDGNRRIVLGAPDDMQVKVDYTDLLVEEEQLKQKNGK